MNVQLTPELEQMIDAKVRTGRFNSRSEVDREALSLMDVGDRIKEKQKLELRDMIAAGLKSIDEGKGVDGDSVFARLEAELDDEIRTEDERISRERAVFQ